MFGTALAFYYYLLFIIVTCVFRNVTSLTFTDKKCTHPTQCVEIFNCPYFVQLLESTPIPRPYWVFRILRKHHCGFQHEIPKVCCMKTKKQINSQKTGSFSDTHDNVYHPNLNLLPTSRDCGKVSDERNTFRIMKGSKTRLLEFPWMALLVFYTRNGMEPKCGGTIINKFYVLTAAHCIVNINLTLAGVRVGEYNLNTKTDCDSSTNFCSPPVQDIFAESVTVHQDYKPEKFENDIALIKLVKPINFTFENAQPVCLPVSKTTKYDLDNNFAVVTGWGVTENGFSNPDLLKVSVPIIPNEECQKLNKQYASVTKNQICAGGFLGRDSCSGDSGGPLKLMINEEDGTKRYVQIGIVSYGPVDCGKQGYPGVYTNVIKYAKWILDNLKPTLD